MRRGRIAAFVVLMAPAVFAAHALGTCHDASPEQTVQNVLPDAKTFIAARGDCRKRVYVAPGVGTPECRNRPGKFLCILTYHNCEGAKNVYSSERDSGAGMCSDYCAVLDELKNREICCDREPSKPRKGK